MSLNLCLDQDTLKSNRISLEGESIRIMVKLLNSHFPYSLSFWDKW